MRKPGLFEILVCVLLTACYAVAPASAGGVDVLERGRVLKLLDQLGITTNGVYTEPASAIDGTAGQWTVDASGDLVPATDNADDLGDSSFRPRIVRAATRFEAPTALVTQSVNGSGTATFTSYLEILRDVTSPVANPLILTTAHSAEVLSNTGASEKAAAQLPSAAIGLRYRATIANAFGLRLVAVGDDTIRIRGNVTSVAGYVESVTVGSTITLIAASATEWIAFAEGPWTNGTWTANTLGDLTPTDGNIAVGNGAAWVAESGATARTSLGIGTGDSPTFAGVTLGADVGLSRSAANQLQLGTAASGRDAFIAGQGFFSDPFGGTDYFKVWIDPAQGVLLELNKQVKWDGGQANSGAPDVGIGRNAAGVLTVTNGSTGSGILRAGVCLGRLKGANFNVTTDQAIPINSSRYVVRKIVVNNASISLTTAAGGVYTAASKGGTALVAAGQVYSALTAATKFVDLTLEAVAGTDVVTATTLYLSLTTAQGAAATADIYVYGDALP